MGLVLGYDGKMRALQATTSTTALTPISQLYVGLLTNLPADYDSLTLAQLLDVGGADNEPTPSASWYENGRKPIAFPLPTTATVDGASVVNDLTAAQWMNNTGSDVFVNGAFITDVQSGTSGLVLWVGPNDLGQNIIGDGSPANIDYNGVTLTID